MYVELVGIRLPMAGGRNHERKADNSSKKTPSTFRGFCNWRLHLDAADSCHLGLDKPQCKPRQFAKGNYEASAHDYLCANANNF